MTRFIYSGFEFLKDKEGWKMVEMDDRTTVAYLSFNGHRWEITFNGMRIAHKNDLRVIIWFLDQSELQVEG